MPSLQQVIGANYLVPVIHALAALSEEQLVILVGLEPEGEEAAALSREELTDRAVQQVTAADRATPNSDGAIDVFLEADGDRCLKVRPL